MSEVRIRSAPSPAGFLHIGGLRTALYNHLYAKRNNGKFLLRIEDANRTRYVEGVIGNLLEQLKWAGLDPDEGVVLDDEGNVTEVRECGPYIQSDGVKQGLYQKYVDESIEKGHVYHCFCLKGRLDQVKAQQKADGLMPKYDGLCRGISIEDTKERIANGEEYVIRLKPPENKEITFNDAIRGEITFNTSGMDDQVLIKSDGFPAYHFAVVVDDHLMRIIHIVYGDEWISSTAKHVYLYQCFGWDVPEFVHSPVVLNKSGKKSSKRNDDVAVKDFRKKGYLPEAIGNYLALVGWLSEDSQEVMLMEELKHKFDFNGVSKSGGVFDTEKLNRINGHYIKEIENEKLASMLKPYLVEDGVISEDYPEYKLIEIVSLFREELDYLAEITEEVEFSFKDYEMDDDAKEFLNYGKLDKLMNVLGEEIGSVDEIEKEFASGVMKKVQKRTGIKSKDLWTTTRTIVAGNAHGPDLDSIMVVLGKQEVLDRINKALNR